MSPGRKLHLNRRKGSPIDVRRRVLLSFLLALVVIYGSAVVTSLATDGNFSGARGELWATVMAVGGLLVLAYPHPSTWRWMIALICAALAPPLTMLFHDQLAAQVWALIPAMLLALYIRAVLGRWRARIFCASLAGISVAALLVAPAPAPTLWAFLFVVCILGAAEIFGALGATLLDGAMRDPLTSVWNRTGAVTATARLVARAQRRGEEIAVIVFDVDDFKGVNDLHGHAAGDRILIDLTASWTTMAPPNSVVARLGGDEFVVIVADHDFARAEALAVELIDGHSVTVTYGVAVGSPDADVLGSLLAEADADLYRRKLRRHQS